MEERLKQSLLGGLQGVSAPESNIPELARSFEGAFQSAAAGSVGNVLGGISEVKGINRRAREESARKRKLLDLQDEARKLKEREANAYTRQDDTGVRRFYDGDDNELTPFEYAQITGQKITNLLNDSADPIHQQFVQDRRALEEIMVARINKDTKTLATYQQNSPEAFQRIMEMQPRELLERFRDYYPEVYNRSGGQAVEGRRMTPSPAANTIGYVDGSGRVVEQEEALDSEGNLRSGLNPIDSSMYTNPRSRINAPYNTGYQEQLHKAQEMARQKRDKQKRNRWVDSFTNAITSIPSVSIGGL